MNYWHRLIMAAALACSVLSSGVQAQDYPNRRVTIVVPYGAGGSADAMLRLLADGLSQRWGQPVILEFKSGAGGLIAAEYVAKSPPDGYTILQASASYTVFPLLYKDLKFDPLKDLALVAMVAENETLFATSVGIPVKNWADFAAYAKANPGKVNYASLGRSQTMMNMELLARQAKLKLTEIAYKTVADYMQGVIRNDVQLVANSALAVKPLIDSGRVTPLFVIGNERLSYLPSVPTNREVGLGDFRPYYWLGLLVPSAASQTIQTRLNGDVSSVVRTPEFKAQADKIGMRPFSPPIEDVKKLAEDSVTESAALAKTLNIRPE